MNLVSLGATLRGCRALRDRTLADVALSVTSSGTILSAAALGGIESGKSPGPRVEVVWAVLDELKIDPDLRWALIMATCSEPDAVLP